MTTKTLLALALAALPWLAEAASTTLLQRYDAAVRDSVVVDPAEIATNLVAVNPNNTNLIWNNDKTLVKVVTWKSRTSYEKYLLPYTETSPSEANVVWVTMAPRIHNFCHNYLVKNPTATATNLNNRLKQRLGLHPDWQYDVFVEMWVSPTDIFRPCVDPSPADSTCNLNFGATPPTVKNVADYPAFYKNLYFNSFRGAPGVPWTGLGYTYDWNNPLYERGESEFILSPSTPYLIEKAVPTWDYCAQ